MRDSLFRYLSSDVIARLISDAQTRVCYVAPGIQDAVAAAICSGIVSNPKLRISVSVDFNEAVFRMGYGSLKAVQQLNESDIEVVNSPGLRAAVLIVDGRRLGVYSNCSLSRTRATQRRNSQRHPAHAGANRGSGSSDFPEGKRRCNFGGSNGRCATDVGKHRFRNRERTGDSGGVRAYQRE